MLGSAGEIGKQLLSISHKSFCGTSRERINYSSLGPFNCFQLHGSAKSLVKCCFLEKDSVFFFSLKRLPSKKQTLLIWYWASYTQLKGIKGRFSFVLVKRLCWVLLNASSVTLNASSVTWPGVIGGLGGLAQHHAPSSRQPSRGWSDPVCVQVDLLCSCAT